MLIHAYFGKYALIPIFSSYAAVRAAGINWSVCSPDLSPVKLCGADTMSCMQKTLKSHIKQGKDYHFCSKLTANKNKFTHKSFNIYSSDATRNLQNTERD